MTNLLGLHLRGHIYGDGEELIFGMLIGLHIWRLYIWGGSYVQRGGVRINGILRYTHKYQVEINNKYISTEKFRVQKSFCANIFIVYFHLKFFHTYSYCQYIKLTSVCMCVAQLLKKKFVWRIFYVLCWYLIISWQLEGVDFKYDGFQNCISKIPKQCIFGSKFVCFAWNFSFWQIRGFWFLIWQ